MKCVIATAVCLVLAGQSVVFAAGGVGRTSTTSAVAAASDQPLLKAAIREVSRLDIHPASTQDPEPKSEGSWVERHPVWTGAIAGFAVGFVMTYASGGDHPIIDPAGPALVFGGVGAGIGALAGWGISRADNRNGIWAPNGRRR
jgi:hypothetical protein